MSDEIDFFEREDPLEYNVFTSEIITGANTEENLNKLAQTIESLSRRKNDKIKATVIRDALLIEKVWGIPQTVTVENYGDVISSLPTRNPSNLIAAFQTAAIDNEINILSGLQILNGDPSKELQEQIDIRKGRRPLSDPMSDLVDKLSSGQKGKMATAMMSFPITIAGQLPRWISAARYGSLPMLKYGLIGGAAAGSLFPGVGTVAGGGAGLSSGALTGAWAINSLAEIGNMWESVKNESDVDPEDVRVLLGAAGALISGIDVGSFAWMGKLAFSPFKKKLMSSIVTPHIKKYLAKLSSKKVGKAVITGVKVGAKATIAGGGELITEGIQEIIGGLAEYKAMDIDIDSKAVSDLIDRASVAALLSFPVGFFLGGSGSSFAHASSYISEQRTAKQVKSFSNMVDDFVEKIEKIEDIKQPKEITKQTQKPDEDLILKKLQRKSKIHLEPSQTVPIGKDLVNNIEKDMVSIKGKQRKVSIAKFAKKNNMEIQQVRDTFKRKQAAIKGEITKQKIRTTEVTGSFQKAISDHIQNFAQKGKFALFTENFHNIKSTKNINYASLLLDTGKIIGYIEDGQYIKATPEKTIQEMGWEESTNPDTPITAEDESIGKKSIDREFWGAIDAFLALDDFKDVRRKNIDTGKKTLPTGLEKAERFNYIGQIVNDLADLASLFSIWRSKKIETSHIVYMKRNKIINKETQTSKLKRQTPWFTGDAKNDTDAINEIDSRMREQGADGWYLVHNHPSGNPAWSQNDILLHDKMKKDSSGYIGGLITDTTTYSFKAKEDADFTIHEIDESGISGADIAKIALEDSAAAFIMSKDEVASIITVTDTMTEANMENAINAFGGDNAMVVTVDEATFDKWKGKKKISRVAKFTDGKLETEAENPDGRFDSFPKLMDLMDVEDGPVPRSVKLFRKFWHALSNKYKITQPKGISIIQDGKDGFNLRLEGNPVDVRLSAHWDEGLPKISVDVASTHPGLKSFKFEASVTQSEEGLSISIENQDKLSGFQYRFIKRYLHRMPDMVFREGPKYNPQMMEYISAGVKETIQDFNRQKLSWKLAPIAEYSKNMPLKKMFLQVANELTILDEKGLNNTNDYAVLKGILWEMAKTRVELEGMKIEGVPKITRIIRSFISHPLTSSSLKESFVRGVLEADEFGVRLPFTQKETRLLKKAENKKPEERTRSEREILIRESLPDLSSLSYTKLKILEDSLLRFKAIKEDSLVSKIGLRNFLLEDALVRAPQEIRAYRTEKNDYLSPGENHRLNNILNATSFFFRNYFVDRQKQFFYLIEHIAGRDSVLYHFLFRNLQNQDNAYRRMKQNYEDLFSEMTEDAGLSKKDITKWAETTVDFEGVKLTNSQMLHIYMQWQSERGRQKIEQAGYMWTSPENTRVALNSSIINFESVINAVENDPIAAVVYKPFRAIYDSLGNAVSRTSRNLYGIDFKYVENYYPEIAAYEAYQKGEKELPVKITDSSGERITLAKDFLITREEGVWPLELPVGGAFATLARSMNKEARFVHMEKGFFQASKILYDIEFKNSIINSKGLGIAYWKLIEKGLEQWALSSMDIENSWDSVLFFIRKQATRAGLGLNPFTATKAYISFLYALRFMPLNHAMNAVWRTMTDKTLKRQYIEKSPGFRDRVAGGALPSVNDIINETGSSFPSNNWKTRDRILFSLIHFADSNTVTAVMDGAVSYFFDAVQKGEMTADMKHLVGLDESYIQNMNEQQRFEIAIAYADQVIQRTQPDFRAQSRNQFQRGTSLERLLSVFGSFVTITHNMMIDMVHRVHHEGLSGTNIKEILLTSSLIMAVAAGNEGVEALKALLLKRKQRNLFQIMNTALFNNTFVLRDIANIVSNKLTLGSHIGGAGGLDTFSRYIDMTISGMLIFVDGIIEDDSEKTVEGMKTFLRALSVFFGAPSTFIFNSMEFIEGLQE